MELLKLQKYNEHRQETGETLAPTGPPTWWNMAAIPAFRCGIGILFARLWSPLIWIFLVPLVSSHRAPAQAHNPFDTITNGQPTRQLSSTVPNTSSAGSNRKRGVAKHEVELTGIRGWSPAFSARRSRPRVLRLDVQPVDRNCGGAGDRRCVSLRSMSTQQRECFWV